MKRLLCTALATAFFSLSAPAAVSAQASILLGVDAIVPTGTFGDLADVGYGGSAGVLFPIGASGLAAGAVGIYASLSHTSPPSPDGDKTNLYGGFGFVGYLLGDPEGISVGLFGGAGILAHSFKPATGSGSSDSGLAAGAGVNVGFPLGGVSGSVGASYITGISDAIDGTDFISIGIGVTIPLGGGDM